MSGLRDGLEAVDTFDRRVAEMALEGRAPGAPVPQSVIVTDPKTGLWSSSNYLGVELPFAPNADNRQTILKCPEWGFPETWTVSLGISDTSLHDPATFNGRNITAVIEFGVGGITQTIRVDWKLGTQITLVTNSINVIAEFANIDVGIGEGDFKLSVQLCRGNRPSNSLAPTKVLVVPPAPHFGDVPPDTVLEGIILAPGQLTGLIELPKFSSMLHIVPAGFTSGVTHNALFDSTTLVNIISGPGLGSLTNAAYNGDILKDLGGVIPIFGSCLLMQIDNTDLTDSIGFSVFVELAG
jgi:hypothetical protein